MPMSLGGWSVLGVLAAATIVAGIVLLIVYAARRGLVHRELDGTFAELPQGAPPAVQAGGEARTLGVIGAALLAVGLVLGLVVTVAGWGGAGWIMGGGPGEHPENCAQSWSGCPQANPGASTEP
jgi:hypothetical protein